MSLELHMRITELEGALADARRAATQRGNFIEALGITVLDEDNWTEGERMLREALGREPIKEDKE